MKIGAAQRQKQAPPLVVAPQPPISSKRDKTSTHRTRWGWLLLLFMRILACLWMLRGVLVWGGILGVAPMTPIRLELLPIGDAALMLFFAIFDLVVAVGLWLTAPWGGVLWLVAALVQIAESIVGTTGSFWGNLLSGLLNLILIVGYFALSWLAAQERDEVSA